MKVDIQKVILWFVGSFCTAMFTGMIGIFGWLIGHSHEISDIRNAYERREQILHAAELIDEVHDLQRKDIEQDQKLDTLKRWNRLILEGKIPRDSVRILNRNGEWKTYPSNTPWLLRRN